ncbi:hypothetical protein SAMN05444678_102304 [Sphingomonas sp. YR710]|uniref:hypothetical protein n=1 Tax=Sphingomonas sp. YR710 TaxID=1882773 RepID=UPI00088A17B1|nr:hypothetical protein [Sphingomonas sp. YR710]SDC32342.1 hypothetical protein SAMN05444678_102304 [Sphingomonas sp. YR710]
MNTAVDVTSKVDALLEVARTEAAFDYDIAEMLPLQLEAMNERFQDRIDKIKLLRNRAEAGGVSQVRQASDIVPLLFAHTAYKSYPESWLTEQKWDRMGRWLDTVTTGRVEPIDTSDVNGLDDWLGRLESQGHYVSCSSGTTGKCAMMTANARDLEFSGQSLLQALIWAGLKPNQDRRIVGIGQTASSPRARASGRPMMEAIAAKGLAPLTPNTPTITVGAVTEMIVLRKKLADGIATPSEIARYEAESAARQKAMDSAIEQTVEAVIAHRHEKLHISTMFAALYRLAEGVRARGFAAKDFHPENTVYMTGGLKRAQVPANYREVISQTFNLSPQNTIMGYGMQELNSNAPRCRCGRYHMPAWTMLLLLDEAGEKLIEPPKTGEVEGRAAFFDLSLDGRWGGVISGDKVRVTWERCACGARSPSIADDIQRYADGASGDKIACAGAIDAYVRGVS